MASFDLEQFKADSEAYAKRLLARCIDGSMSFDEAGILCAACMDKGLRAYVVDMIGKSFKSFKLGDASANVGRGLN